MALGDTEQGIPTAYTNTDVSLVLLKVVKRH